MDWQFINDCADEDTSAKMAKLDVPSTGLVSGVVSRPMGTGYPPSYAAIPPVYDSSLHAYINQSF